MRRVVVLLIATVTLFMLLGIAAGPVTLDCGTAGTVDAVFELSSSDSFHVVSMSSNFLWKSLAYVTPSGQTGEIDRGIQGDGHANLVTCTYTGPASGNHYTVTGFFTP